MGEIFGKLFDRIVALFIVTDEDAQNMKTWKWALFLGLAMICSIVAVGCIYDSDIFWIYIVGTIAAIPLSALSFKQGNSKVKKIISCIPLLAALPLIVAIFIFWFIYKLIYWLGVGFGWW